MFRVVLNNLVVFYIFVSTSCVHSDLCRWMYAFNISWSLRPKLLITITIMWWVYILLLSCSLGDLTPRASADAAVWAVITLPVHFLYIFRIAWILNTYYISDLPSSRSVTMDQERVRLYNCWFGHVCRLQEDVAVIMMSFSPYRVHLLENMLFVVDHSFLFQTSWNVSNV